jgi:hypothetical protein
MQSFTEFSLKKRLYEMPMRINIPKTGWSQKQIDDLWELISDEEFEKVGEVNGNQIVSLSSGPLKYFFALKNEKPVFLLHFERRIEHSSWQEKIAAKGSTNLTLFDFYKFLNNKLKMFIVSDFQHLKGTEKSWKAMLSKSTTKFEIINDETGKLLDVNLEDVWGDSEKFLDLVVKIKKL